MSVKTQDRKSETSASKGGARRSRFNPGTRWLVIAGGIAVVTVGLAYGVWRQVRSHVLASQQYQVDPAQIRMSPAPPWIRSDIKNEVLREASFTGPLSLLDTELTIRIASAFATHPWIASVQRVSKHFPSGLDVEVAYRRPVAMVEVTEGALPVDAEGVVLPTSDFKPGEADRYPRIGGIQTSPGGLVGSAWGDAAVVGAAQIAAALANDFQTLQLFRIVPSGRHPGGRGGVEYTFAIYTRGGTQIDWGLAPNTTVIGEPPSGEKLARIKQHIAKNGPLDGGVPQHLRFDDKGTLEAVARAPVAPLPREE